MRAQIAVAALLLACAAQSWAKNDAQSPSSWETRARSTLLRELQAKRPEITQWEIEPRVSDRQQQLLADVTVEDAVVMQQGARSSVRLRWRAQGRQQMTTVWFATRGFGAVFVAKEKLSVHDTLSPDSGVWSQSDVMGLRCEAVTDTQALLGMRTTVPVHQGEPICRDKLEAMPLVAKGRKVTVQSFAGPVVVTGKAVAQADGQLGAKLRVKSASSGIVYLAVVTGEQQVSVYD
jgi:flagella basal body P-ring formation protein FlgA